MAKKATKRQERAERVKARKEQTRAEAWDGWEDEAERLRGEVENVGSMSTQALPTFNYGAGRKEHPIGVNDLALTLFAVEQVGEYGASYEQCKRCFKRWDVSWHRNKQRPMFIWLVDVGLIELVGNYSTGHHGNRYRRTGLNRKMSEQDLQDFLNDIGQ